MSQKSLLLELSNYHVKPFFPSNVNVNFLFFYGIYFKKQLRTEAKAKNANKGQIINRTLHKTIQNLPSSIITANIVRYKLTLFYTCINPKITKPQLFGSILVTV